MKKLNLKKIVLSIFFLLIFILDSFALGSINIAQATTGVPTILSYQGRLTNSSGDLVGGSYTFKFSIWDAATGGTQNPDQLWPAGNPRSFAATVRQGMFTVNIGDTVGGFPDTLDYNFNSNKNIYLQIEVSSNGTDFETILPRQRISSAPFAQISGAVSGTGQSSFGTTTPVSNAVVTIEATTTSSIPALIRASVGQLASLFRIEDSSLNHLFSINSLGGVFASSSLVVGSSTATSFIVGNNGSVGVGTGAPSRKFNVLDVNSVPQLRLSQSSSVYGEFYVDSAGDVQLSSTGGNFRMQNENLWVCSGGSCDPAVTPVGEGNIVVETALIFDNKFKLKQTGVSTTIMYDTTNDPILEFDEGQ